eukprot:2030866-Amphidinium_carterae.3
MVGIACIPMWGMLEELPVVVIPKQLDVTNMHELLDDACSADEQAPLEFVVFKHSINDALDPYLQDWELFAQNLEAQVLKSTAEVDAANQSPRLKDCQA